MNIPAGVVVIVMLNGAKNLRMAREILRSVQHDNDDSC